MVSSQYSTGRFPKVSIGIRVEKSQKAGCEQSKKNGIVLPTIPQRKPLHEDFPRETSISRTVPNCDTSINITDQNTSAKLSKMPGFLDRPVEAHVIPKQASEINPEKVTFKKLTTASVRYQADPDENASAWLSTEPEVHTTQESETFQFFVKRASIEELQNGAQKHAGRFENISDNERMEKTKFTSLQSHVLDGSISREHSKGIKHNDEALRMKLSEILGTGSQSKQVLTSPAHEGTNIPSKKQNEDKQKAVAKAKPDSDTVEPNSERTNPTTSSLTSSKNIQSTRKSGKLPLSSSNSASKLKFEDKNIFTFNEIETKETRVSRHANGHPSSLKKKSTELMKARTQPRRIHFPVKLNPERTSPFDGNHQSVPSPVKKSRSQEAEPSPCQPVMKKYNLRIPNNIHNMSKDLLQDDNRRTASSPLLSNAKTLNYSDNQKKKTNESEFINRAPREIHLENGVITPSKENKKTPLFDFNSPNFAVNASTPSTRNDLLDDDLPTSEIKRACASDESYKPESKSPNTEANSSIANEDSQELQDTKLPSDLEYKETEKQPSLSPKEDDEYMSFEGASFFSKGHKPSDKWFSDVGNLGQPTVKSYQRKMAHGLKSKRISNNDLLSSSPIGVSKTEETIGANEVLDQLPEDSMERAVYQLALILQQFKSKMKTQSGKRSSEILSSAEEKVHLQLQDAASQIEATLDNFISTDQTKRKRLESKIQDQQKRLRLMYDKFKEEVNQNLEDCRSIFDEFDAYQTEIKRSSDKQKVSQKKLLLQLENSIETQLNDAERKVTELNKDGNRKMKQLKGILKEWMTECLVN